MVDGSVTISIEDFQTLVDAKLKASETEDNAKKAIKELQIFLSFLCTRTNIEDHTNEFNRQSKTTTIDIENGRAKIILKDVE